MGHDLDYYGADYSSLEAAEARSEVLQEVIEILQNAIPDTSLPTVTEPGLRRAIEIVQEMDR